jgi:hypothetical protein
MVDFLKFFLPLAGAAVAWFWNERRKRIAEEYERKEAKYAALIESLQGFYIGDARTDESRKQKQRFLTELNNSWLYCPDEVIRRAYEFLAKVHTGAKYSDEEKELAVGELVLAIRKDLLGRKRVLSTKLTAADFRHLKVN